MNKCPFKLGDWVLYKPCDRGRGWEPFGGLLMVLIYPMLWGIIAERILRLLEK